MADPLYRQIADDLRQKIESGELAPGSQLPTELDLREQYGNASRNTIRDAIKALSNQGLVISYAGRGTFVAEKIKPFVVPLRLGEQGSDSGEAELGGDSSRAFRTAAERQGRTADVGEPRVEVQNARPDVARELRIEPGATVVSRHQRRFIDKSSNSLQTSFYPMDFVQQGAVDLLQAKDIDMGATTYIEEKLGIKRAGHRDRLLVRPPNAGELAFFRLPDAGNLLVLVTLRTLYAHGLKPLRYTVTVYPADRNQLVIESGEVPPLQELIEEL